MTSHYTGYYGASMGQSRSSEEFAAMAYGEEHHLEDLSHHLPQPNQVMHSQPNDLMQSHYSLPAQSEFPPHFNCQSNPHPIAYSLPNDQGGYPGYYPAQNSGYPPVATHDPFAHMTSDYPGAMGMGGGVMRAKAKPKEPKIGRPHNSFILYRRDKQKEIVRDNPNLNQKFVSKKVGEMWKNESKEVKEHYARLAEIEKQEHKKRHPDYRYNPRRTDRTKKKHDSFDRELSTGPFDPAMAAHDPYYLNHHGAPHHPHHGSDVVPSFYPVPAYGAPSMAGYPQPAADFMSHRPAVGSGHYNRSQSLAPLPSGASASSPLLNGASNPRARRLSTNDVFIDLIQRLPDIPGPTDYNTISATHQQQRYTEPPQSITTADSGYNSFVTEWDQATAIQDLGDNRSSSAASSGDGQIKYSNGGSPQNVQRSFDGAYHMNPAQGSLLPSDSSDLSHSSDATAGTSATAVPGPAATSFPESTSGLQFASDSNATYSIPPYLANYPTTNPTGL
ncbi:slightly ste11-like protein [Tieghemiomyces parasiticus]|uniref:Slightly ste11-like protein n=1 Tax=Tieghemiomyces parasiticus TaxID=78921 RepID=A0A9W8AC34_9FUNG|nr:slightly ste11-like protein [Tieghemiomyces parasiticus]